MASRCLAAVCLLAASAASAEPLQHELLVFGSAEIAQTPGDTVLVADSDRALVAADVLFSLQRGPFKVFGEYLLTNHESDLERFQIGWEPSERVTFWLGRFHQPSSVWNSEHHHGQYLQTSITRPVAENWEDDGGIIPQHFVGLLADSNWDLPGERVLKLSAGAGLAPTLGLKGLEAFDLFHPEEPAGGFGYQVRLALMPDAFSDSAIGLVFAHDKLDWVGARPAALPTLSHADLFITGAYAMYALENWKFSLVGYYVDASLLGTNARDSDFLLGYATVERALPHDLRVFGRFEDCSHVADSPYLALFPEFVTRRSTLGLRWDFARRHALTAQISDSRTQAHGFMEYRLQWSAALL
jgi:hypothetical protein